MEKVSSSRREVGQALVVIQAKQRHDYTTAEGGAGPSKACNQKQARLFRQTDTTVFSQSW